MKLACQEGLVPGRCLEEKLDKLSAWGYEGIEFWGGNLWEREHEIAAALANSAVRASSICAGYGGCLLDAGPAERQKALDDIPRLLDVAGRLGAVALIVVPIFGGPRLPDLSPMKTAVELEKDLAVRLMKDLAKRAGKAGTTILLEPLNRYETHFLNRLEQAVEICERVKHPNVQIMADFFHMSIEEADTPASIAAAGKHIRHVHLADNTRQQPGTGSIDFRAGFRALKKIGYKGYMALECGVVGDDRDAALKACAQYLKRCMRG